MRDRGEGKKKQNKVKVAIVIKDLERRKNRNVTNVVLLYDRTTYIYVMVILTCR